MKNNKVVCIKSGSHGGCDGCHHYKEHEILICTECKPCTVWADCANWDNGEIIKQRCVHVGRNLKCFDKK